MKDHFFKGDFFCAFFLFISGCTGSSLLSEGLF